LKVAVLGATAFATIAYAREGAENPKLEGTWTFRSFIIDPTPGEAPAGVDPKAMSAPFVPAKGYNWAPPGTLKIGEKGDGSTGWTLTFPARPPATEPFVLDVDIKITPGSDGSPPSLEARAVGQKVKAVAYLLKGWFVPDSPDRYKVVKVATPPGFGPAGIDKSKDRMSVRGTVVNSGMDLAQEHNLTVGTFVLVPALPSP